ncbi:nitroreductase family protein [Lactobacillus crispatus]|uniref:Nitroreductase family protein n=1 Tax=Lactobacillus crispatus TaxID=47770 RepID=A0A2M9WP74_9LACO|nr:MULTISPECIES: nitroreductase family protein [Lactobacillus]MDD7005680.1 nitroreductase family protein [Lactobacillus johnsonii]MDY2786707.1 nitroreductase family protein [Lactobacillus amylovorus]MDY6195740.1 nitroreductase family protein [Lactobacillus johnsonii]PJZ17224.1 nitroreductase family protein [Lactobacillus crispatus]
MTLVNNDFHKILTERHSVRRFDKSIKIDREEMKEMLEETITAPSACNLQAWKFVVVDTEEGREKLHQYFMKFNFPQIDDSSAVVLFFGNTLAYKKYSQLWHSMYEEKKVTKEAMEAALNTFMPLYEKAPQQMLVADSMVDTSLAAMQFMLIAREHGYETNAMAGYDAGKAAEAMGLDPKQYVPVMAIAIGKHDPKAEAEITTTRYSLDELVDFK